MTAMRLTATAPKKIAPSTPGWPKVTWRCFSGKDLLADLECDDVGDERHREGECRHRCCFARDYESPRRHGREGRADHARGVLGGDRPHGERSEQYGGDHDAEQRAARRVERPTLGWRHGGPLTGLG